MCYRWTSYTWLLSSTSNPINTSILLLLIMEGHSTCYRWTDWLTVHCPSEGYDSNEFLWANVGPLILVFEYCMLEYPPSKLDCRKSLSLRKCSFYQPIWRRNLLILFYFYFFLHILWKVISGTFRESKMMVNFTPKCFLHMREKQKLCEICIIHYNHYTIFVW